jgi:hypothetical protein
MTSSSLLLIKNTVTVFKLPKILEVYVSLEKFTPILTINE